MGFNPLAERGLALDKQFRNWAETNVMPYDKNVVHPYTRTRIILMNGAEVEAAFFGHQFARHCGDLLTKQKLAAVRRVEQQQQKQVNGLIPGEESILELTIGYEQVAVDLTAALAKTESDAYVKAALDFGLLEDFDHLYRYANLMMTLDSERADRITRDLTEITPGRPTILEHRYPFDDVRKPYDGASADILTKLHVMTITAAEQQTMNYYMNVANRFATETARGLYQEIGTIEEQHVTHYESLADPKASWLEMLVMHEYNECYLYYSCMMSEVDDRIRRVWEQNLACEIEHLKMACDLMRLHEKRDPESFLPAELPTLTIFEDCKPYVRQVLASQVDLTAVQEPPSEEAPGLIKGVVEGLREMVGAQAERKAETEFVPASRLDESSRYRRYQQAVNSGPYVPSQRAIEESIARHGEDYRRELLGPHPVDRLRRRDKVAV